MSTLIFPDVNVWLALNYEQHIHNPIATAWYEGLKSSATLVFCRHTQLGLFRLLSMEVVMKQDCLSQKQCWQAYDPWIESGLAILAPDPEGLDEELRTRSSEKLVSPKIWADAYLSAFAETAGLQLVTFDRALAAKVKDAVLLN
jgi:toxin-antitoxin system PIN domain toxin